MFQTRRLLAVACRHALPRHTLHHRSLPPSFLLPRAFTSTSHLRAPPSSTDVKNKDIPYDTITLISVTGENLGPHSLKKALAQLDSSREDLVLVSTTQNPPVCKVVDRVAEREKARVARLAKKEAKLRAAEGAESDESQEGPKPPKKLRADVLKEFEIGSTIADHDLEIKLKKVRQNLEKGYRVKITIVNRLGPADKGNVKGKQLLERVERELADTAPILGDVVAEGKRIFVTFGKRA
ncbi:hypothetical protein HK104_001049 [Borealophlyctis nickersoniae]|nr:hypothetical protein HK104_001049 [Borealophlyctis nickersoniae]